MRKALIVGIDQNPLNEGEISNFCPSVEVISKLLEQNEVDGESKGTPNFDCQLLTSSSHVITRAVLRENCKELFEDDEADVALFYFSGYCFDDPMGTYLMPQGAKQSDGGFSLNDLMIYANNSSIKEVNIILDCHYTGDAFRKVRTNGSFAMLRKGVSVLSAKSTGRTDLFSRLIITALRGGNAAILGDVTFIDLYEQAAGILSDKEYDITFNTNSSRLTVLRKSISKIPYETLVKIRCYFHSPNYHFPLDKEHIPSQKLGRLDKQKDYKTLQKLNKYGLVKPVNAIHFYYAAFNEKHCSLTNRGKQYWELIEKNRI